MNNPRRSIAIAHPGLRHGGSEARALWAIQALQQDYHVTLLTGLPPEWDRLNAAYCTQVDPERVQVREAPMPRRLKQGGAGDALRGAFFGRFCRKVGPSFDLCISAYNPVDFGRPGIQFVADMSWDASLSLRYDHAHPGLRGVFRRNRLLRSAYLASVRRIGGRASGHGLGSRDTVLANSRWISRLLEERYSVRAKVVYPPVSVPVLTHEASDQTANFLVLGRLSPEKRIEESIDILTEVRKAVQNVTLHIAGPLDDSPYAKKVQRRARDAGSWVKLHGGVYGQAKLDLIGEMAYGLHLCPAEAFGIAVAEQVKMGLIPFVPSEGGPAEIVDDKRLTFGTRAEAIEKIKAVLGDARLQKGLLHQLSNRAVQFSTDRFVTELEALVRKHLTA